MDALYPEIDPYAQGMLDSGDGNQIYWETCGQAAGKPVVVLHGGPGSGCRPRLRRFFDPACYRIILFDQRGCGRSRPHAGGPVADLSTNTTWHLIADIELLRETFGIERWMVCGGSWGSTLALAYAQAYPQHVSEMLLWGVAMTRPAEIDWLYHGVAPLFPEQWAKLTRDMPGKRGAGEILSWFHERLHSPDAEVRMQAARDFHEWDWALFNVVGNEKPGDWWLEPAFQLARARIVTHYFRHAAWLEDGILLKNATKLAGIPGIMVHGRMDVGSPLLAAWELSRAWSDSELVIVPGAGHSTSDPGMEQALVMAADRWKLRTPG